MMIAVYQLLHRSRDRLSSPLCPCSACLSFNHRIYATVLRPSVLCVTYTVAKGRNPHKRTSWKLVGNPGYQPEKVAN